MYRYPLKMVIRKNRFLDESFRNPQSVDNNHEHPKLYEVFMTVNSNAGRKNNGKVYGI